MIEQLKALLTDQPTILMRAQMVWESQSLVGPISSQHENDD